MRAAPELCDEPVGAANNTSRRRRQRRPPADAHNPQRRLPADAAPRVLELEAQRADGVSKCCDCACAVGRIAGTWGTSATVGTAAVGT